MDTENVALDRFTGIPPKLVEEAANDPRALERVARAMAAVNLHNLFMQAKKEGVGVSTLLSLQTMLNRMGRIDREDAQAGGSLPMVQITIGQGGASVRLSSAAPMPPAPAEVVDVVEAKGEAQGVENRPAPKPIPTLNAKPLTPDAFDGLFNEHSA